MSGIFSLKRNKSLKRIDYQLIKVGENGANFEFRIKKNDVENLNFEYPNFFL